VYNTKAYQINADTEVKVRYSDQEILLNIGLLFSYSQNHLTLAALAWFPYSLSSSESDDKHKIHFCHFGGGR